MPMLNYTSCGTVWEDSTQCTTNYIARVNSVFRSVWKMWNIIELL